MTRAPFFSLDQFDQSLEETSATNPPGGHPGSSPSAQRFGFAVAGRQRHRGREDGQRRLRSGGLCPPGGGDEGDQRKQRVGVLRRCPGRLFWFVVLLVFFVDFL